MCHGLVDAPLHPTAGLDSRGEAAGGGFVAFKIIRREKRLNFCKGGDGGASR